MSISSLESLHRKAKGLEASIEVKIQSFSMMAQKMNADFLCDEENALLSKREEEIAASEIDRLLVDLFDCINSMKEYDESVPNLGNHKNSLIKRYDEIYFDYKGEFQNISTALRRKRERMKLFEATGKMQEGGDEDSATAKLLKERNTIANSMRSIGDVISEANEARFFLKNQRSLLDSGFGQLSGMNTRLPTFNQVIDGIQRKKVKDMAILATIIGACLIFMIWWIAS